MKEKEYLNSRSLAILSETLFFENKSSIQVSKVTQVN